MVCRQSIGTRDDLKKLTVGFLQCSLMLYDFSTYFSFIVSGNKYLQFKEKERAQHLILIKLAISLFLVYCQTLIITFFNIYIFTQSFKTSLTKIYTPQQLWGVFWLRDTRKLVKIRIYNNWPLPLLLKMLHLQSFSNCIQHCLCLPVRDIFLVPCSHSLSSF